MILSAVWYRLLMAMSPNIIPVILTMTLPYADRSLIFFSFDTQWYICNKIITEARTHLKLVLWHLIKQLMPFLHAVLADSPVYVPLCYECNVLYRHEWPAWNVCRATSNDSSRAEKWTVGGQIIKGSRLEVPTWTGKFFHAHTAAMPWTGGVLCWIEERERQATTENRPTTFSPRYMAS